LSEEVWILKWIYRTETFEGQLSEYEIERKLCRTKIPEDIIQTLLSNLVEGEIE